MPTTVHIPEALLEAVDRRARALQVSRNRLIVQALTREVSPPPGWSPEFLGCLRAVEAGVAETMDEVMTGVIRARRSKKPQDL
jgi:predicted transcriptional regulator